MRLAQISTLALICIGCGGTGAGANDAAAGGTGKGGGMGGANGGAGGAPGRVYATKFPLTENPISEGGNWINGQAVGLDWHDVSTVPGLAIGHQSGSSYTDGTALLTGNWGPTQTVQAVVHTINPKESCYQEVEMRLRSTLTAHSCTGYEISFDSQGRSECLFAPVRQPGNGAVGGRDHGQQHRVRVSGRSVRCATSGVG